MSELRNKRGSNYVLVIILILVLGLLAGGYALLLEFNLRSSVVQRKNVQGYYLAQSVENALVKDVMSKNNAAVKSLEEKAHRDYEDYLNYAKSFSEASTSQQDTMISPENYKNIRVQNPYVTNGETTLSDGTIVKNRLEYYFEEKYLLVSTEVEYLGEAFHAGAKLVFEEADNPDPPITGKAPYTLGVVTGEEVYMQLQVRNPKGGPGTMILGGGLASEFLHHHVGNVISPEGIYLGELTILDGNIWSEKEIELTTATVHGNLYSLEEIALYEGISNVFGDLYAAQKITIQDGAHTVQGDVYCDGDVVVSGPSSCYTIRSKGNVVVEDGAYIEGDIVAEGNVYIKQATVQGAIYAGGEVYVDFGISSIGKEANGNSILAKGNITAFSGTFSGSLYSGQNIKIYGNSVTVGANNSGNRLVAVKDITYPWGIRPEIYARTVCNGKINGRPSGISGVVEPTIPVLLPVKQVGDFKPLDLKACTKQLDYQSVAVKKGIVTKKQLSKDGVVLDARDSDVYYVIQPGSNGRVDIDGSLIQIIGNHRVFLVSQNPHSYRIYNTVGNESTSNRLFLVSNATGKEAPSLEFLSEAKFYGQIYMPGASMDIQQFWSSQASVYGIVTVNSLSGYSHGSFQVYHRDGDYSGTLLASFFGGNTGGQIPTEPGELTWKVEKYYEK